MVKKSKNLKNLTQQINKKRRKKIFQEKRLKIKKIINYKKSNKSIKTKTNPKIVKHN